MNFTSLSKPNSLTKRKARGRRKKKGAVVRVYLFIFVCSCDVKWLCDCVLIGKVGSNPSCGLVIFVWRENSFHI